jgi:hypothetical protein
MPYEDEIRYRRSIASVQQAIRSKRSPNVRAVSPHLSKGDTCQRRAALLAAADAVANRTAKLMGDAKPKAEVVPIGARRQSS